MPLALAAQGRSIKSVTAGRVWRVLAAGYCDKVPYGPRSGVLWYTREAFDGGLLPVYALASGDPDSTST